MSEVPPEQQQLMAALMRKLGEQGAAPELHETHISWVIVAGGFAYKLKKAVRFDFLDFSTLEARRFYCNEELRLNRRLAPDLYLDVVAISGDARHPDLNGSGTPIEYAVRMRAFAQDALWSYRIPHDLISAVEIDALAEEVSRFHRNAAVASPESPWGTLSLIVQASDETLKTLSQLAPDETTPQQLASLHVWEQSQRETLCEEFRRRKAEERVRECHGDLHGGNLLTLGNRVEAFDCIEFNDSLRWIDVMNDLAFICMDLAFQQHADHAAAMLNRYLEIGGDYAGLKVLRYYEVHRALVRAKVMLLLAAQQQKENKYDDEALHNRKAGLAYLAFATRHAQTRPVVLMITHGCSGSGKSSLAPHLVRLLGAVQVRSDVERKRMRGFGATDRGGADAGLYAAQATQGVYARLLQLARIILASGRHAIVDAAFLQAAQRKPFRELAAELGIPFFVFVVHAPPPVLRARVASRERAGRDASDAGIAILDRQLQSMEAVSGQERMQAIFVDTEAGIDAERTRALCAPVLAALREETSSADATSSHRTE